MNHARLTNICRLDERHEPTFQTASISIYKIRHVKRLSSIFKIVNCFANKNSANLAFYQLWFPSCHMANLFDMSYDTLNHYQVAGSLVYHQTQIYHIFPITHYGLCRTRSQNHQTHCRHGDKRLQPINRQFLW